MTRPVSSKILAKTNFLSGLSFLELSELNVEDNLTFTVPSVKAPVSYSNTSQVSGSEDRDNICTIIFDPERISKLERVVSVFSNVLKFINRLKATSNRKKGSDYKIVDDSSLPQTALNCLIRQDQNSHFLEIVNYLASGPTAVKSIPSLVSQLNLFVDSEGILRVKCKLRSWGKLVNFPILLSKQSYVAKLLIVKIHENLAHGGVYSVLANLRKSYWIPSYFTVVKRVLRDCVHCKRFNSRSIKLNQSPYRDFRLEPT